AICLFASQVPFLMFKYYEPRRVICSISEAYYRDGRTLWIQIMLGVNILTLVPYALTWIHLRSREKSSYTKRVFRAISLVMIFDVGGWLTAVSIGKLIQTSAMSGDILLILLEICGCIVQLGISIKPIIYYNTSIEYNKAFRALFGFDRA
ncbi:hypothetical protein PMAYCL1PPCAC_09781, partial [Pristionchus mayeri]